MSYFNLLREFNNRYRTYSKGRLKKVVKKAYKQLTNGEEIRWEHIKKFANGRTKMKTFLVDLPQIEEIRDVLSEKLENVRDFEEKDVQVIYGEYGEGKTQTGQLILEWFNEEQNYPKTIPIFQSLTTMPKFFWSISQKIRDRLQGQPILGEIKKHLNYLSFGQLDNRFFNHPTEDKIAIPRIIEEFNNLLLRLGTYGINVVLILDELDRVLTKIDEWKPWGDLFTSLTGNLKLLIILLMPQSLSEKIVNADSRMKRWSTHFNFNAKFLSGTISNGLVEKFVANVLALSAASKSRKIKDEYLELVDKCVENQRENLTQEKIRSLNMWAVSVSEIVQKLIDDKFLKKKDKFEKLAAQQKGQLLENRLRLFLQNNRFPDITHSVGEEELDLYKCVYDPQNLEHPDGILSDGHVKLQKIKNEQTVWEKEVAVEIKFTTSEQHNPKEIEKIQELSKYWPTVFVSIGSDESFAQEFRSKVKKWQRGNQVRKPNYPVLLIQVPKKLESFLLVIPEDNARYRVIEGIVRFWGKSIINFLPKLHNFLDELPDLLSERKVEIRVQKLEELERSIMEERQQVKADTPVSSGKQHDLLGVRATSHQTNPRTLKAANGPIKISASSLEENGKAAEKRAFSKYLCAFIEEKIGSYKTMRVFLRDFKKGVSKKIPKMVPLFNEEIDTQLAKLESISMVRQGKRGSKEVLYKQDQWDSAKAFRCLLN